MLNLCKPGFRITESSVKDLASKLEREMANIEMANTVLDNCTVILQLLDNTVYSVDQAVYGTYRKLISTDTIT